MSMERELQDFITEEILLDPSRRIAHPDEPLITSGRVDSLGLLRIAQFVQDHYGVDILSVAGPEDFETIRGIVAVIGQNQGKPRVARPQEDAG